MGQDKSQLMIGAHTLLDFMKSKLRAAGLAEIWVSGPLNGAIPDLHSGLGPLGGIASAVARAADHSQLLVVAVDQPRLSVRLLHALLEVPDVAAVRFGREPLPMRLRVDPQLRQLLRASLSAPDHAARSLHALQQSVSITKLTTSADELKKLSSVNTPEQWRDFLLGF